MPSLRNRLLVILLGLFTLAWLSMVVVTYLNTRQQIEELFEAQLAEAAQVLLELTEHQIVDGSLAELRSDLSTPPGHHYAKDLAFQVWVHGRLILRSAGAPDIPMTDVTGFSDGVIDGQRWRLLYRRDAGQDLQLIVGERYDVRDDLILKIVVQVFWPFLVALPVLTVLIILGVGRGLAPVERVAEEVGRRSPQQLDPVGTRNAPAEIHPLIGELDKLLARLRDALESERRFTADAAHELRTPLAVLKAQAQVAQRTQADEERRRALEQVVVGVNRATRLVDQLLTLARLDPDAAIEQHDRVALRGIAENVVVELLSAATAKGIDLGLTENEPGYIMGTADALAIMVRNLVDNAVRYSPEGSRVDVTIQREGEEVELSVTDNGPGIAETDRERVLHRFYRVTGSRQPGSGLGLSIVKRIAELHSGRVEIRTPSSGRGTTVAVTFPAAEPEPDVA